MVSKTIGDIMNDTSDSHIYIGIRNYRYYLFNRMGFIGYIKYNENNTNKILVLFDVGISAGNYALLKLLRGSTGIYIGDASSNRERAYGSINNDSAVNGYYYAVARLTGVYLDSPSTTSSTRSTTSRNSCSGTRSSSRASCARSA